MYESQSLLRQLSCEDLYKKGPLIITISNHALYMFHPLRVSQSKLPKIPEETAPLLINSLLSSLKKFYNFQIELNSNSNQQNKAELLNWQKK